MRNLTKSISSSNGCGILSWTVMVRTNFFISLTVCKERWISSQTSLDR
jgi:hypothetical protein